MSDHIFAEQKIHFPLGKLLLRQKVEAESAGEMFNAAMIMDLGVYSIDKGTYDIYKKFNSNGIVDKVVDKETEVLNDRLEYNVSDGWRVRLQELLPVPTNRKDSFTAKESEYQTV